MKKLIDLCLDNVANNLFGNICSLVQNISFRHKEILLERLIIHDYLTPSYLPYITYNLFCSSLRRICFYQSHQVTDNVLEKLSDCGCQLSYLKIFNCVNITDYGISSLTKCLNDLQTLKLELLSNLTGICLAKIISYSLENVEMNRCKNLTSQNLKVFFKQNPNIIRLSLAKCRSLDCTVFDHISNYLTKLEELILNDFHDLDDYSLIKLTSKCTNIKKMHLLACNKITDESLSKLISHCSQLSDLDLSYCTFLQSPDSLLLLKNCKNLNQLSLLGIQLNDEDVLVDILLNLPKIKDVKLAGMDALTDNALHKILQSIGKQLTHLHVNYCQLTDLGVEAVSKYCVNLTHLGLCMMKITGITLLSLFKNIKLATKLIELHLSCTDVNDDVLYWLSTNCVSLTFLSVTEVKNVNDDFLINLANNCKQLTGISMKNCSKVSDEGIIHLALNCPLESLILAGVNKLTDNCINVLRNHCPELKELYVAGCSLISEEALLRLTDTVNWRLDLT